ncbi:MAG: fimbria/pilus periplasmic chaperone [Gammaproteobacteria bacterium]|nr:fimbria/pilus periplasmic chaperone [Gammaproteobacteria bacterium]
MSPVKNIISLILRLSLSSVLSLLLIPVNVFGDVLVSPTRVIFEKHTRTSSVNIVNTSNIPNTYRIEFVERRMKTDGGFEEVKKALPGELFSSKMIRFSPRQVTLQPGQGQAIRLMLRKPANLAHGEYRSHMLFRAIPKATTNSVQKINEAKNISIKINPVIGISIPVIVRHGQVSASISVENLRYYAKASKVRFDMTREGNASVYGDITFLFKDHTGQTTVLRKINGIAIYSPNASRRMSVDIPPPGGTQIKNGTLTVQFHHTKEVGGQLITHHSVNIP